ncbi:MAG: T9SS type A sorting domain-containing protein [Bacteroidota bacterium]|nr:T9SS type A sorting domain-containing protein [Bacteroidota bacterium]
MLYLQWSPSNGKPLAISIADLAGRHVQAYSVSSAGSAALDFSSVAVGVYFVTLQTILGQKTVKVVISR